MAKWVSKWLIKTSLSIWLKSSPCKKKHMQETVCNYPIHFFAEVIHSSVDCQCFQWFELIWWFCTAAGSCASSIPPAEPWDWKHSAGNAEWGWAPAKGTNGVSWIEGMSSSTLRWTLFKAEGLSLLSLAPVCTGRAFTKASAKLGQPYESQALRKCALYTAAAKESQSSLVCFSPTTANLISRKNLYKMLTRKITAIVKSKVFMLL